MLSLIALLKRRAAPVFVLLLGTLLSGCQSLSGWFPFGQEPSDAARLSYPDPYPRAGHQFALAADQSLVGSLAAVDAQDGDTLSDIARHYGLGFNEIQIANPSLRPWSPAPGSRVLLPMAFLLPDAPRKGIVLNLASMRLFYYPKNDASTVYSYPVGIGRQGWSSPIGATSVVAKQPNPVWHVPESIQREHAEKGDVLPKVVRSGPDNPLGYYALRLGFPSYLIHGTNKPYGIGMQISHGCIQLYPEDIEVLFGKVAVGAKVNIVHQPYLAGWDSGRLYVEAHPPLEKWSGSAAKLKKQFMKQLKTLAASHHAEVDWARVDQVLQRADGIPAPVLKNSPDLAVLSAEARHFSHPAHLYGQPTVTDLTDNDWAMRVAAYPTAAEAEQLAAMLNHQGPPIPARPVQYNGEYHVIAGPFKNKQEAMKAVKRVRMDFELKAQAIAPRQSS